MELVFFLKVQLTLAAGYLLYHVLFRKGVSLVARRIYLLTLPVFALTISSIEKPVMLVQSVLPVMDIRSVAVAEAATANTSAGQPWYILGYTLIAAVFVILLSAHLFRLLIHMRQVPQQVMPDHVLIEHEKVVAPYSFFRYICLPVIDDRTARQAILQHELAHVRQWHSADILYISLFRALCWINPVSWILMRELRLVHECLADAAASCSNVVDYAELLVARQFKTERTVLQNTFYQPSQIQQRLMALQTTAPVRTWMRVCLVIPCMVLLGMVNLNAQTVKQEPATDKVEKMPEYPGGNEAMMQYLATGIQYPAAASKNNIQGTVYVEFTVKKNGNIAKVAVAKGVHADLDAEAVRVIQSMPDWIPGEVDGKKVDYDMMLPIRFALN